MPAAAMSASREGARVAHSAYRRPSICLLSAIERTRSERLIPNYQSQQREGEQRRLPGRRPGRLCRRRDAIGKSHPDRARAQREPAGSLSYFAGLPELDDVVLADDRHLTPALLVVGRACVGHGEVVVGRDNASYLVQWLRACLAREHLVLDRVPAHALVVCRQTAGPHTSGAP